MMQPVAELHITLLRDPDTGQETVNVQGPIVNKLLCYGMLERCRDAVHDFDPAKAQGLVVPQNGSRLAV